jgi:hypothetical protein
MGRIEILQRSSLLPGVLSFRSKGREALAVKRREFIMLLGGAAAWPLAARAQRPLPVLGMIGDLPLWDHFRKGMRELGYIEGLASCGRWR